MSFKTTLAWLAVALALLGSILLLQRVGKKPAPLSAPGLPGIKSASITKVQVRPGRGLEIQAVRTNGTWQLIEPLLWPAEQAAIEQFISALEKLSPTTFITPAELRARPGAEAEYGLNDPRASIVLYYPEGRSHLLVGSLTSPGDSFFLQVVGAEGVYVLGADFLKVLPSSPNDWRDRSIADLNRLRFNTVNVTNQGKVLSIQREHAGPWRLVSPIRSRGNQQGIHDALEKTHSLRIVDFVSDDPKEDLEPFGLQPPKLQLVFQQDNSQLVHLQFGNSVSNLVYARRSDWHSVVTVGRDFVSDWENRVSSFREPFLLASDEPVQSIEVAGPTPFKVAWVPSGQWQISPSNWIGDPHLLKEFIEALNGLRITEFVKDVVTPPDLPPYGLDVPAIKYGIEHQTLNQQSNRIVELHFGQPKDGKVFARRTDEDSIYEVAAQQAQALPSAPWQLRDRRLWSFAVDDVRSVTFTNSGQFRQLVRKDGRMWTLAPGSQGIIKNQLAIDETVKGLASPAVDKWVALGASHEAQFGITEAAPRVILELNDGSRFVLAFGNSTPASGAFSAVILEGQTWIGEFPWILCRDIMAWLAPPEEN